MTFNADLVVESEQGQLIAIVEVRAVDYLDRDVAVETYQNLVADYALPRTSYFLMVSQYRGFLWSKKQYDADDVAVPVEFSMEPAIRRFVPDAESDRLRGESLELVVFQWLLHLTVPTITNDDDDLPLRDTPFARAIEYGRVLIGAHV